MADEQYRWLDRDAAERLLNGEPLEAVDPGTRDQVDRLTEALGALAAVPDPSSDELPGEAAALAAFRKARADGDGAVEQLGHRSRARSGAHAADAGLVRIGRPAAHGRRTRWGRPTRFGIAAVLAVGMVGGVAVAAGTGVLPTPFTREHPGPAASATAVRTPERPLVSTSPSPSPGISGGNGPVVPETDGPSGEPSKDTSPSAGPDYASGLPTPGSTGNADRTREWWARTRSYCRDVLDGRDLDADRRRLLEHVAGGGARVRLYCSGVLGRGPGGDTGDGAGAGGEQGTGQDSGRGDQGDSGDGDGDGHHIGPGGNDPRSDGDGTPSALRRVLTPLLPVAPTWSSPSGPEPF
ncbi:hypothetical protein [Streptomyces triticiradicis]|uniref:Extensin n=1 Tax=Streptomyces triticiradicis TaxID=2651189 RepID=A0A7J5DIZ3_9ACTN|nr:hypothetical protein [Streptomyces triticiradicis]KAB1988625.1 hypothetical protein F8144_11130 [Streptomyces triticiradicis]